MRTMVIALMAICLISGIAIANEKPVHGPTDYVPVAELGSRAVGDDCTDPIAVTLPGDMPYTDVNTTCDRGNNYSDTCLGSYDGGEDIIYELNVTVDGYYDIFLTTEASWTGLAIDVACPLGDPCLDKATGSSGDKVLTGLNLVVGTYYVMIDTWPSPACIDEFTLTISAGTPPPPPPENDLCQDAEIIPAGAFDISGDTTQANDDYTPTDGGCTGYGQAAGADVVYAICLIDGSTFDVTMTTNNGVGGSWDDSIYLVLDCEDIDGTCVAGDDAYPDGSTFEYTNTSGANQQLYLIVDGYSSSAFGMFNIIGTNGGGCEPVGNEALSWGSIKSLYR